METLSFIVATGMECSAPVIAGGLRRDELRLTGHWDRVEEDLDLVVALGITHLRYGIPFHVVASDPDELDWAWTDRAMAAIRERPVEPIVDLVHFGVPEDLTGFGDPRLPVRFVTYATAFAERYPWVRWYTPVNEPLITALGSAKRGWWNERQDDDGSFVRALDNVATCAVEGMRIVRERRPDAIFLQSEACEAFAPADPADPIDVAGAAHLNELRFIAFDLTYGRPVEPAMALWLASNGFGHDRTDWFEANGSDAGAIVGLDYYPGNERLVEGDRESPASERRGFAAVAREYQERYGLPIMLAETNTTADKAVAWFTELWNDTIRLFDDGVPIVGFCWYSLTDQVDWDTCLREPNGTVNPLGLVDLDRRRRTLAGPYEAVARAVLRDGRPSLLEPGFGAT
jgi:beta-glucosidase/6-phospho-beta-glucosidase/beta-galactosidase